MYNFCNKITDISQSLAVPFMHNINLLDVIYDQRLIYKLQYCSIMRNARRNRSEFSITL